jgi:hypothetical protein
MDFTRYSATRFFLFLSLLAFGGFYNTCSAALAVPKAPEAADFMRVTNKTDYEQAVNDATEAVEKEPEKTNEIIGGAIGDLLKNFFAPYWTGRTKAIADAKTKNEAARVARVEEAKRVEDEKRVARVEDEKRVADAEKARLDAEEAKRVADAAEALKKQQEEKDRLAAAGKAGVAESAKVTAARDALTALFNKKPIVFTLVDNLQDKINKLSPETDDDTIDAIINAIVTACENADKPAAKKDDSPNYLDYLVTLTKRSKNDLTEIMNPLIQ